MADKRKDSKGRILRANEGQTKDGEYKGRYYYRYKGNDGKPKSLYSWRLEPTDRLPKGKKMDLSLREKEKDLLRNQLNGGSNDGGNMTVLDMYVRHTKSKSIVKPTTTASRERRKKMLEDDILGSRRVSNVNQTDVEAWAVRMKSKGIAYNTIRSDKVALKAAFETAGNSSRKNPFDFKLSQIIENDTEPKAALNAAQEKSLMDYVRTDQVYSRYYDETIILLGTGLRISELCGLTVKDVDLEKGIINIDHQLLWTDAAGCYVDTPKSHHGIRKIPMSQEVREAFCRVLDRPRNAKAEISGYRDFLFCKKDGQPRTARDYERIFKRLRQKHAKLYGQVLPEKFTPHTLRHTFCTRMAQTDIKPKALQHIMGHSSLALTMEYYAHTDSDFAIEEMQRVQATPR